MYLAIRRYRLDAPVGQEVIDRANAGLAPLLRQQSGFHAYITVKVSDTDVFSVSLFETEESMTAANETAAKWVRENLAALVPRPPEITAGQAWATMG
jgi:heme-degrading monooxygenase HmoA